MSPTSTAKCERLLRSQVPKRPNNLAPYQSGASVVYDQGDFRWRVNSSGLLLAFFEYWPDHKTRAGLPWKKAYFRPGMRT